MQRWLTPYTFIHAGSLRLNMLSGFALPNDCTPIKARYDGAGQMFDHVFAGAASHLITPRSVIGQRYDCLGKRFGIPRVRDKAALRFG